MAKGKVSLIVPGEPTSLISEPIKVFTGGDRNNFNFPIGYSNVPSTSITTGQTLANVTEVDTEFNIKATTSGTISGSGVLMVEFDGFVNKPPGSYTYNLSMLGSTLSLTILAM